MKLGVFGKLFLAVVIGGAAACAAGCSDDKEEDDPQAGYVDYTVMVYGCGGANLDDMMMMNLEEAACVDTERVKMTAQVKFSKEYQNDPDRQGTRRFVIDDEDNQLEVLDGSLPLYKPENLADFINWSKAKCPARNYFLILWNHGNGWVPETDSPKSRGVLFDDNNGSLCMSIKELAEGIRLSGTHMEVIYFDACLMSMLENYAELEPLTDYVLGAAHTTPGIGGEYGALRTLLDRGLGIETAVARYCRVVMNHWKTDPGNQHKDITLTKTSALPEVYEILATVAAELVSDYEEYSEQYEGALEETYRLDTEYPYYDVADYVEHLAYFSSKPRLFTCSSLLQLAVEDAIVCRESIGISDVSWGITVVDHEFWTPEYYGNGAYQALEFDKRIGWSKWLQLNGTPVPEK